MNQTKKSKISIIILNWNQPDLTINCVKSVLSQKEQDFEIILIDNGSEDDSAERLEKEFGNHPKIIFIKNKKNLGYAGGNNVGARLAKGKYVVILNNDTIVEQDWLAKLVSALESDKNTALVESRILEGDRKDIPLNNQYWVPGIAWYGVLAPHENKKYFEIFQACGCSLMYKKDIVGVPFDDDYFIYAEDTYLSWFTRLKGHKIRAAIDSIVHHHHNTAKKSDKKIARYFTFLGERNKMLNYLIFYDWKTLVRIWPMIMLGAGMASIYEMKKIPSRLKSYFWLLAHPRWVWKKRKLVQSQRKVPDREILRFLSCKIFDETRVHTKIKRLLVRTVNSISKNYCRLMNIRTIELQKK